jgi:large subunit ribosomal protein L29
MKAKEMRDLAQDELAEQITTLRKDLFGLRFANATGELEDTASVRRTKRELARALTIARENGYTIMDR